MSITLSLLNIVIVTGAEDIHQLCNYNATTKHFTCGQPDKIGVYQSLPADLFKNLSKILGEPHQEEIEFHRIDFNGDVTPILWDMSFEKIVFDDCLMTNAPNTFANNYGETEEIEVESRTVSDGMIQEFGKFTNLKSVIIKGPEINSTSQTNKFVLNNYAFFPYNGFQVILLTFNYHC